MKEDLTSTTETSSPTSAFRQKKIDRSMAAYAALVSLMNDLELIQNHPRHSFSFDYIQIASLSQTTHFLVDFLESYNSDGCSRDTVEALESRITSAAHASHDVIESYVVDQILAGSTLREKARSYFLIDLQKVIGNMDYVKRKAMQFKERSGLKAEHPTYSLTTSSQHLTSRKNVMVGFDVVVVRLMGMLTGEPSSRQVIPVVGMGGMGKTTLVLHAYEHLLIEQHFDVRLWATISQEYSVETILTQLLFGDRKSFDGNVNELGENLHKMLWGRRYLIILDDMWSLDAWDEIQMFLPDNSNGSCVIVTTRLSKLANHLSFSPFEMSFLDKNESWQLFCAEAFAEEECPLQLKEIGKKIVKRCRGLPLSIVVIGGHLRKSSREIEYWEKAANFMSPIRSLDEDEQCLKTISLSYHHLPAYLKPCILYMGSYGEDEKIDVYELLQYWVAEGFLKPNKALSLEEVAEDYLNDLVERNLILVRERKWNGKAKTCGVHDIVRELCLKIAKNERFVCVIDDAIAICRERRIVIPTGKHASAIKGAMKLSPLLRSLMRQEGLLLFDEVSVDLRLLRVSANVNNVFWNENGGCSPPLAANFEQVNLRYLASFCMMPFTSFGTCKRHYLPSSISLFWNLQILNMTNIGLPFTAPYEIWEMAQLRHLEFTHLCLPDPPPHEECIVLQNLHTLLGVDDFRLTDEVCKRMPNIRALTVEYNKNLPCDHEAFSDYCPYNLGRFCKLESLKCKFGEDFKWSDSALCFTFPTSLQELSLKGSHLQWEDSAKIIASLPHLGSLEFVGIKGPVWNLAEEEFSQLKILKISCCGDLINWNANSSHFPVLEILTMVLLPNLGEIPLDIGEIPTLRRIELEGCSASAAVSTMQIVVEQESLGNQELQVDVNFLEMEQVEIFQKMVQQQDLKSTNLLLFYRKHKIRPF